MDCIKCSKELTTQSNYFIEDVGFPDFLWECSCGQKYEVDHYCGEDGCYEAILPVKEST